MGFGAGNRQAWQLVGSHPANSAGAGLPGGIQHFGIQHWLSMVG
jgi:hypothetical protein